MIYNSFLCMKTSKITFEMFSLERIIKIKLQFNDNWNNGS